MNDQKKDLHECPFADYTKTDKGGGSIEGRFSRLETEVSSLAHGQEALERSVADGFKEVFRRIESIGTTRSLSTVPWIMVGFAVLGLIATVGYQSINGVATGVTKSESNLALSNARELQYREDKGQLTQTIVDFRARLLEIDDKAKQQAVAVMDRLSDRVKATDEKMNLLFTQQQRTNDTVQENQAKYELWRLNHVKELAYSQGRNDAVHEISGKKKVE